MKSLLLATVIFCTTGLFAQDRSNLTISTTGNSNLKITFNGHKYSLQDRSVTFQSLSPGNYPLTIFQLQKRRDGAEEYITVFSNTITLNPKKHLEVSVLRFGKTAWDENFIERDDWNQSNYNPSSGFNNNNRIPVDPTRFTSIRKAITSEVNEDDRIRVCQVAMKDNWFSIAQIRDISNTFFNETNKLAVVKFAYDRCTDPGTYISLTDMFYNSGNRRDLVDFIAGKQ